MAADKSWALTLGQIIHRVKEALLYFDKVLVKFSFFLEAATKHLLTSEVRVWLFGCFYHSLQVSDRLLELNLAIGKHLLF